MGPINYIPQQIDLGQSFLTGLEVGNKLVEARQIQEQRELALQQTKQYKIDLAEAFKNPTAEVFGVLALKYPGQREAIISSSKLFTEAQQTSAFNDASKIFNALSVGNNEAALKIATIKRDALKNAGRPTEDYDLIIETINRNPKEAQTTIGLIGASIDPKKWTETFKSQPDIQKAQSEATEMEAKAKKATVEAKYAEESAVQELKNKAAALGLTKAQTSQALAATRKLGVESQKAALELAGLKATGGLDPAKTFDQEEKLRKEYQARTKVYSELGTTFNNIEASATSKTGAGDIALITGFMKMLDPGSVVRETEFATARDTAGLYARLENSLSKAESGEFLRPKQRQEYLNLAREYYNSAQKKADDDKKALKIVVKNYKLNPENVFGEEQKQEKQLPTNVSVGDKTYAGHQILLTNSGKVILKQQELFNEPRGMA